MDLSSLKRWHWVVISLLLGGLLAGVWRTVGTPDFNEMGQSFSDQPLFEKLVAPDAAGNRAFRNLTVYSVQIDGQRFHAVVGTREAKPRPLETQVFIATTPYIPVARYGKPAPADSTVMTFLRTVPGASFRYAWWCDPRYSTVIFVGGSFVLVGLIWPTLINLLVFGGLRRPPEEAAVSLAGVIGSTTAPAAPTAEDKEELEAHITALQPESLDGESPAGERPLPDQPVAPSPPRPLAEEAAVSTAVHPGDSREFGAKPDDFYPTERKSSHGPPL